MHTQWITLWSYFERWYEPDHEYEQVGQTESELNQGFKYQGLLHHAQLPATNIIWIKEIYETITFW